MWVLLGRIHVLLILLIITYVGGGGAGGGGGGGGGASAVDKGGPGPAAPYFSREWHSLGGRGDGGWGGGLIFPGVELGVDEGGGHGDGRIRERGMAAAGEGGGQETICPSIVGRGAEESPHRGRRTEGGYDCQGAAGKSRGVCLHLRGGGRGRGAKDGRKTRIAHLDGVVKRMKMSGKLPEDKKKSRKRREREEEKAAMEKLDQYEMTIDQDDNDRRGSDDSLSSSSDDDEASKAPISSSTGGDSFETDDGYSDELGSDDDNPRAQKKRLLEKSAKKRAKAERAVLKDKKKPTMGERRKQIVDEMLVRGSEADDASDGIGGGGKEDEEEDRKFVIVDPTDVRRELMRRRSEREAKAMTADVGMEEDREPDDVPLVRGKVGRAQKSKQARAMEEIMGQMAAKDKFGGNEPDDDDDDDGVDGLGEDDGEKGGERKEKWDDGEKEKEKKKKKEEKDKHKEVVVHAVRVPSEHRRLQEGVKAAKSGQMLILEEGKVRWRALTMSGKERSIKLEAWRMKSLEQWDYEPADDMLKDREYYHEFAKTYVDLHPTRSTWIQEPLMNAEMELPPKHVEVDRERYVYVANTTLHVQGTPKQGTRLQCDVMRNGGPRIIPFPESRADGQWVLAKGSNGSFFDVCMAYPREWRDAAEECVRIIAGPWEFTRAHVRCGGNAAIVCHREASIALTNSSVGGLPSKLSDRRLSEMATDGVRLLGNSSCYMHGCTVEDTGLLKGAGVHVRDGARAKIEWSHLHHNKYYAVTLADAAWVEASDSLFQSNYWSCMSTQPDVPDASDTVKSRAHAATLVLRGNRFYASDPWFNSTRPGTLREGGNSYFT